MTEKKNLFGSLLQKEGFYKASTIVQDLAVKVPQRSSAFSTSPGLSWTSSGGFVPGTMSLWIGPRSSGKTMIVLDILKQFLNQEPDSVAVFVDAEMSFEYEETLKWMASNGIDLDRILVIREVCIKEIFEVKILKELQLAIRNEGVKISALAIDSVQAMSTLNIPETDKQIINASKDGSLTKNDYGGRANYLAKIFPFYRKFIRDYRIHTLLIGQARIKGTDSYGNPIYDTNGGEALFHEMQYMYLVQQAGDPIFHSTEKDINGNPVKIGHKVKIICRKNKMGDGQDKQTITHIVYMQGIVDTEEEAILIASKLGIINQAGAWYEYNGQKYNGSTKFAEALKEDKLLYREIYNKIIFKSSL